MKPRELYDAQLLEKNIWARRDLCIDLPEPDQPHIDELAKTAALLGTMASDIYDAWQELGGKSNCESITAEKYRRISIECDCDITLDDDLPCSFCECPDIAFSGLTTSPAPCGHCEAEELEQDLFF